MDKIEKLTPRSTTKKTVSSRDEYYVINLCDDIIKEKASRQHRFDFLLGDPNKKGKRAKLPVDAYYEKHNLVIEYRERQHTESVSIMDNKITISNVDRKEQRKIYDKRREEMLPKNGIKFIIISYSDFNFDNKKRIKRGQDDKAIIKKLLSKEL
jgi:hypothetical protein